MGISDKKLAEYSMAMLYKLYILYSEGKISYKTYLKNIELKLKFLKDYASKNYSYPFQ
jgi:hypothetical protein